MSAMTRQPCRVLRMAAMLGEASRSVRLGGELEHAADSVLAFHQLEPGVDLVEREPVGDERVDVDVPGQVTIDQLRYLLAALDATERRAEHVATGDQVAGNDVERLAPAGDADHAGRAPTHPRRLDGLAHDRDVAGRLERVVGAEAVALLEHSLDHVRAAGPSVR